MSSEGEKVQEHCGGCSKCWGSCSWILNERQRVRGQFTLHISLELSHVTAFCVSSFSKCHLNPELFFYLFSPVAMGDPPWPKRPSCACASLRVMPPEILHHVGLTCFALILALCRMKWNILLSLRTTFFGVWVMHERKQNQQCTPWANRMLYVNCITARLKIIPTEGETTSYNAFMSACILTFAFPQLPH